MQEPIPALQFTTKSPKPKLSNTSSSGCPKPLTLIVTGSRLAGSRVDKVEPFTSPSPPPLHKTTKHLHLPASKPSNPPPNQAQSHTPPKNATTKPSHPPLHPPPLPHALPTPTTTTPPASNPSSNPTDPEHNVYASALPAKPLSHTTTHLHPIAARVRPTYPPRTEPQTESREPHTAPDTAQQPSPAPTPAGASTSTSTGSSRTSTPLYPALSRL